jgi:hypothetical protein
LQESAALTNRLRRAKTARAHSAIAPRALRANSEKPLPLQNKTTGIRRDFRAFRNALRAPRRRLSAPRESGPLESRNSFKISLLIAYFGSDRKVAIFDAQRIRTPIKSPFCLSYFQNAHSIKKAPRIFF